MIRRLNVRPNPKSRKPKWFMATGGKCFYCGKPMYDLGQPQRRDWLFLSRGAVAVREHAVPVVRGGDNSQANLRPSCSRCNGEKGAFTADEFRFVRGFRHRSLNYRFAFDPPGVRRDWLCTHSREFERELIVLNMPSAAVAFEMRSRGAKRGPKSAQK